MIYSDLIFEVRYWVPCLTFIFFAFLLLFSESAYKKHSFIIVASCFIYYLMPDANETLTAAEYKAEFIKQTMISIMINGAGALAMSAILFNDRKAAPHTLIYSFIIFHHVMLSLYLINGSSWYSFMNYALYDEILILTAITQVMVSYNGLTSALCNVQRMLSRVYIYSNRVSKGLPGQTNRESKT